MYHVLTLVFYLPNHDAKHLTDAEVVFFFGVNGIVGPAGPVGPMFHVLSRSAGPFLALILYRILLSNPHLPGTFLNPKPEVSNVDFNYFQFVVVLTCF